MTEFEKMCDEFFPYRKDGKPSYRPYQKEAVVKALDALVSNDYDIFFLDAPVGYGKSGTLVTLLRIIEAMGYDGYLNTPQLILQDQYNKEFPEIPMIKGRSNYPCLDDPESNCSDAECQVDESYKCPHKESCVYSAQRTRCQESSICQMNTAYLLTVRKEVFDKRFLMCVDEAHSIPEAGVGFVSVNIREDDVGMIPVFEKGFEAYLIWLEKMVYPKTSEREKELKERIKSFGKSKRKAAMGVFEEYKRIRDLNKKIELLSGDYAENKEEWIFDIVTDKRGKKIVFQPITSGRFLNRILWNRGEKIVLSSGTIEPDFFMREGGLKDYAFDFNDCVISVPSEFPPEKSPIYYYPLGKMTVKGGCKDRTFPLIIEELNKLIKKRQDRRGIIHTFSYPNAEYIVNNIDPSLRSMLVVQDRFNRSGSLEGWMKTTEPSVFVSTNMTEGLNLAGDACRYQVYLKIGFPNTQDKRVAKRLELGHWIWYNMQAIEDLEQASGRATRSKEDWSEMHIFDASFGNLYVKYNKYIKKWFKDRLIFDS